MARSSIGQFVIGQSAIGGGNSATARASFTVRSWRQIVMDADPDWQRLSTRYWVYEFSNGRRFDQPADPYAGIRGVAITDDDGTIMTDDDGTIITDDL